MRKPILILILLAAFVLPATGSAQAPLKLSSLEINIWPEYDKPSVLVIYNISLPSNVNPPVNISLRIPASAGEPNGVAAVQVDGTLLKLDYTLKAEGDWIAVNFTATMPEEQVEYYDPSLSKQGDTRHFVYTWPGDYAVDSLTVQVQQPYGASNMQITPKQLGNGVVNSDLTYYTISEGSVKAEQTFNISVSYQKPDDSLSSQHLQVLPSAPITDTTKGRVELLPTNSTNTILIVSAMIIGLSLVGGGIYWYFQSSNREVKQSPRRRGRRTPSPEMSDIPMGEGIVYCQQCGNRAGPGDQFCRACGVKLRTE